MFRGPDLQSSLDSLYGIVPIQQASICDSNGSG